MLINAQTTILFILQALILFEIVEGGSKSPYELSANNANENSTSPWLKKTMKPREPRCVKWPWICNQPGEWPPKKLCCNNVCIDVTSDINNCGMCERRCPFTWQCCRGLCSNTNISPINCGKCGNKCPIGVRCLFGMCGYAQPAPPWPFPTLPLFPPRPPFPPLPPFPPKPAMTLFPPFPPMPPKPPMPPMPPMPPFLSTLPTTDQ